MVDVIDLCNKMKGELINSDQYYIDTADLIAFDCTLMEGRLIRIYARSTPICKLTFENVGVIFFKCLLVYVYLYTSLLRFL